MKNSRIIREQTQTSATVILAGRPWVLGCGAENTLANDTPAWQTTL
jgi:hypothetical protein